jgi:dynamin-binding protein
MGSAGDLAREFSKDTTPRSRRVGIASPPPGFNLHNLQNVNLHHSISPPPSPGSPPLPARSPLRPASRSISGGSSTTTASTGTVTGTISTREQTFYRPATPPPLDIDDIVSILEAAVPLPFQMRHRDYLALNALDVDAHIDDMSISKTLPIRPESPFIISPVDEPASSSSSLDQQTPMTKRQHALHELLSSERAYASDLALMRGIHIPLALGNSFFFLVSPFTP